MISRAFTSIVIAHITAIVRLLLPAVQPARQATQIFKGQIKEMRPTIFAIQRTIGNSHAPCPEAVANRFIQFGPFNINTRTATGLAPALAQIQDQLRNATPDTDDGLGHPTHSPIDGVIAHFRDDMNHILKNNRVAVGVTLDGSAFLFPARQILQPHCAGNGREVVSGDAHCRTVTAK